MLHIQEIKNKEGKMFRHKILLTIHAAMPLKPFCLNCMESISGYMWVSSSILNSIKCLDNLIIIDII